MRNHFFWPVLLAGSLALQSASAASGAPTPFLLTESTTTVRAGQSPWVLAQWEVGLDVQALTRESAQLQIELLGHPPLVAHRSYARVLPEGTVAWHGVLTAGEPPADRMGARERMKNMVTLVGSGTRVTGTLRLDGQLYRLQPHNGRHILQEISETRLPDEHAPEPSVPSGRARLKQALTTAGSGKADGHAIIRVLVLASRNAAQVHQDLPALAQLAIEESNQTYANTGIDLSLELAGFEQLAYDESGFPGLDLERIQQPDDGVQDGIHALRDALAADVVVLLTDTGQNGYCGRASRTGASADTAFAFVSWQCIGGALSFPHEIGHLQGAGHDDAGDEPYAFGRGFKHQTPTDTGWRTVMSYDCERPCPRLPYWSDPTRLMDGVPMGDAASADNRRVLDLTRWTVAGFR